MGGEINMGKIVFIIFITLLTSSCTTTSSFLIYNDTNKDVTVTISYAVENPDNTESFVLAPEKSEFWMYEQSSFDTNTFYLQIQSIKLAIDNKCEVSLSRSEIEKQVKKEKDEWQWIFDINLKLFDGC